MRKEEGIKDRLMPKDTGARSSKWEQMMFVNSDKTMQSKKAFYVKPCRITLHGFLDKQCSQPILLYGSMQNQGKTMQS